MEYLKTWKDPQLDKSKPIMFDTETLGLGGKTRLVQLKQGDKLFIYDCFYISIEDIKYYLKDCHLVAHNIHYDLSCIDFQNWLPKDFDDTMFMAKLYYPYLDSFSLKNCLRNLNLDKGDEGASDWSKVLTKEQLSYAAYDVEALDILYHKMISIKDDYSYKLDMYSLRYALHYQLIGMPVHQKNLRSFKTKNRNTLKKIYKELPEDLNINSSPQVKSLLNTESANAQTLRDIVLLKKDNYEMAQNILDAKKLDKQLNFLEKFSQQDRIYGFFVPSMAKSGRWTCKSLPGANMYSQNLQQLPRDLKSVLGYADDDQRYFVDADYPSLELYCMAAVVGEDIMADMLKDGIDLHKYSASIIYNVSMEDVTKYQRQIGKTANFGLGYGGGANMYKEFVKQMASIVLTDQEAVTIREKWLDTYPTVKAWHNNIKKKIFSNDYMIVQTPLGRRMKANTLNDALNLPIQGAGSECTKLSIHYLYQEISNVRIVNTVHDSITLECESEEQAIEQGKILAKCMEKGWNEMNKMMKIQIPMEVDYEVVKTYG